MVHVDFLVLSTKKKMLFKLILFIISPSTCEAFKWIEQAKETEVTGEKKKKRDEERDGLSN